VLNTSDKGHTELLHLQTQGNSLFVSSFYIRQSRIIVVGATLFQRHLLSCICIVLCDIHWTFLCLHLRQIPVSRMHKKRCDLKLSPSLEIFTTPAYLRQPSCTNPQTAANNSAISSTRSRRLLSRVDKPSHRSYSHSHSAGG
jgi:hypothetical protein